MQASHINNTEIMVPPRTRPSADSSSDHALVHRLLLTTSVVVATVIILGLLWYLVDVLLLVFAATLLAILLRAPTDWLHRRSGLPTGWALTIVIAALVSLVATGIALFGRNVSEQMSQLIQRLPEFLQLVQGQFAQYEWLTEYLRPRKLLAGEAQFLGKGLSAISTTFGVFANVAIVLLMAVFLAAQPRTYVNGLLRLFPPPRRPRLRQVTAAIGHILRRWLLGQLVLMTFVATTTWIGLTVLAVPFALALAILAGLLTFVPYVGPVLAAVPAVLVALAQGPVLAGYVALLYIGVQLAEAPLEPIVQQRAVHLPPVLVLVAQIGLGVLIGALGVMLATPLAAASLVAVKMLYIEDVLGDATEE